MGNHQVAQIVEKLMKNPGRYIHVSLNLCVSNKKRFETFEAVTNMLNMMGIRHQVKDGYRIRVLTPEQTEAYQSAKRIFSQRYGYNPPTLMGKKYTSIVMDEVK